MIPSKGGWRSSSTLSCGLCVRQCWPLDSFIAWVLGGSGEERRALWLVSSATSLWWLIALLNAAYLTFCTQVPWNEAEVHRKGYYFILLKVQTQPESADVKFWVCVCSSEMHFSAIDLTREFPVSCTGRFYITTSQLNFIHLFLTFFRKIFIFHPIYLLPLMY